MQNWREKPESISADKIKEIIHVDIAVIGAGHAGTSAARSASEAGAAQRDYEFEPIPGLFAAGNCSGCRFGFQYTTSLPGQSISIAQTLGREVGKYLAEQGGNDHVRYELFKNISGGHPLHCRCHD